MNVSNKAPKTTLGAKFSIPHAVAATLIHGADAPGLEAAVVKFRQAIAAGAIGNATCRAWVAEFFAHGTQSSIEPERNTE